MKKKQPASKSSVSMDPAPGKSRFEPRPFSPRVDDQPSEKTQPGELFDRYLAQRRGVVQREADSDPRQPAPADKDSKARGQRSVEISPGAPAAIIQRKWVGATHMYNGKFYARWEEVDSKMDPRSGWYELTKDGTRRERPGAKRRVVDGKVKEFLDIQEAAALAEGIKEKQGVAEAVRAGFRSLLQVPKPGWLLMGPTKGLDRIKDKIDRDAIGLKDVNDILRATLLYDDFDQLVNGLKSFLGSVRGRNFRFFGKDHKGDPTIKSSGDIDNYKQSFEKPKPSGYRDAKVSFEFRHPPGAEAANAHRILCEVQFNLTKALQVKEGRLKVSMAGGKKIQSQYSVKVSPRDPAVKDVPLWKALIDLKQTKGKPVERFDITSMVNTLKSKKLLSKSDVAAWAAALPKEHDLYELSQSKSKIAKKYKSDTDFFGTFSTQLETCNGIYKKLYQAVYEGEYGVGKSKEEWPEKRG